MDYKKLNRKTIQSHFTTEDFNSVKPNPIASLLNGEISKFRILTVANDIEQNYIENAKLQYRASKFRMKTDILKLREIVCKKFAIYARQHKCLENQQVIGKQNEIYGKLNESTMFIGRYLDQIKSNGFKEMRSAQQKLKSLQQNEIGYELEKLLAYHQCIMLEVHVLCDRLNLLLKIMSYFDIIIYQNKNKMEPTGGNLDSCSAQNMQLKTVDENIISTISMNNIQRIQSSNLNDTKCLDADLWIHGYECIKQKIFNFHQSLTDVANIHFFLFQMNEPTECSMKYNEFNVLNNTIDLKKRALYLKQRSIEISQKLETKQRTDYLHATLNALVPVIWAKIQRKIIEYHPNEIGIISQGIHQNVNVQNGILRMIEDMQWQLMEIFQIMEKIPQDKYIRFEKYLRKRIEAQKIASRRAFIKENRLHNLILHYKKHHRLKK